MIFHKDIVDMKMSIEKRQKNSKRNRKTQILQWPTQ